MNTTLLKVLFATVFFVSVSSCGSSEDGSEGLGSAGNGGSSSNLGGSYNIISMISDISVDLNNDGITSTDLLTEVDPAVFNTSLPELEIKPVLYNNQLEEMMSFYLPHSNIGAISPSNPSGVKFTRSGLGYLYDFNKDTQDISVQNGGNNNEITGHMENIKVVGDNKLQAVFTKSYYDFFVNDWVVLTITCVYTKM
jgi:hypothetical protein